MQCIHAHQRSDTVLGGTLKEATDVPACVQAPFVVWMALVLTVYAVSYTTLGSSSEGLINNSIANNVLFRTVRVLFFAIKYGFSTRAHLLCV
jgi:hypothetical protein